MKSTAESVEIQSRLLGIIIDHLRGIYGADFHNNTRRIQWSQGADESVEIQESGKITQSVIFEESMEHTSTLIIREFSEVYRWIGWANSVKTWGKRT